MVVLDPVRFNIDINITYQRQILLKTYLSEFGFCFWEKTLWPKVTYGREGLFGLWLQGVKSPWGRVGAWHQVTGTEQKQEQKLQSWATKQGSGCNWKWWGFNLKASPSDTMAPASLHHRNFPTQWYQLANRWKNTWSSGSISHWDHHSTAKGPLPW